jgi:hypothetical protein
MSVSWKPEGYSTRHKERDPDRRGGVKHPGGNTWWIATQVA